MDIFDFRKYIADNSIQSICFSSESQNNDGAESLTGLKFNLIFNEFVFLCRLNTILLKNGDSSIAFENIVSIATIPNTPFLNFFEVKCSKNDCIKSYIIMLRKQ